MLAGVTSASPRRFAGGRLIESLRVIQRTSDAVLKVEAGSLYPALHRMTEAGLLKAAWRITDAGRRARVYELTAKGRRRLEAAEKRWLSVSAAVTKILRTSW